MTGYDFLKKYKNIFPDKYILVAKYIERYKDIYNDRLLSINTYNMYIVYNILFIDFA